MTERDTERDTGKPPAPDARDHNGYTRAERFGYPEDEPGPVFLDEDGRPIEGDFLEYLRRRGGGEPPEESTSKEGTSSEKDSQKKNK